MRRHWKYFNIDPHHHPYLGHLCLLRPRNHMSILWPPSSFPWLKLRLANYPPFPGSAAIRRHKTYRLFVQIMYLLHTTSPISRMEDTPIPTHSAWRKGCFQIVKRHCPGTGVICQKYQAAVFPEYPQPDGHLPFFSHRTGLHRIFQQVAQYHRHLPYPGHDICSGSPPGLQNGFYACGPAGGIVA